MSGRYAVIGHPIEHSRSPEIHAAFAAQFGIDLVYDRRAAEPGTFAASARAFFDAGGLGLNVTVPFKGDAYRWVDDRSAAAEAAEAVNTIVPGPGGATGHNTDGPGLVADLLEGCGVALRGARILLLGAGGAAAGVLAPLLAEAPAQLVLANRTVPRAADLARRFPGVEACPFSALQSGFDLVINGTAIGLQGDAADFRRHLPDGLLEGSFAYDMLYGPKAGFGAFARQQGATGSADGLGMLVEQAAGAFTLWHGRCPDTAPVIAALRELDAPDSDRSLDHE
jgi:shikimate dehydrogenase